MKLGIALSGGGAKGTIHLGIIQALEDNGIRADMYAGTSAGAIVASAKAFGLTNKRTFEMMAGINNHLLDFDYLGVLLGLPTKFSKLESLMKGKRLKQLLSQYFDDNIRYALKPLSVVSTDVNSGDQIVFSSMDFIPNMSVYGDGLGLDEMIYASAAIPGIYPPLVWQDKKLIDGTVVNNMPANVLNAMGADKILAIDISGKKKDGGVHGLFSLLSRSLDIMIDQNVDYALASTKNFLIMRPDTTGISLLDFDKVGQGYDMGYAYGLEILDTVKAFLEDTH